MYVAVLRGAGVEEFPYANSWPNYEVLNKLPIHSNCIISSFYTVSMG